MVSEFILSFGCLNLATLTPEERKKVLEKTGLTHTKAVEISDYRKNNNGYWDGAKQHQQVVKKNFTYCRSSISWVFTIVPL